MTIICTDPIEACFYEIGKAATTSRLADLEAGLPTLGATVYELEVLKAMIASRRDQLNVVHELDGRRYAAANRAAKIVTGGYEPRWRN